MTVVDGTYASASGRSRALEREEILAAQAGDERARSALVVAFLPLVGGFVGVGTRGSRPAEFWLYSAVSAPESDAGGGTRTPDTRIMIPLL